MKLKLQLYNGETFLLVEENQRWLYGVYENEWCPGWEAQLVGESSRTPKKVAGSILSQVGRVWEAAGQCFLFRLMFLSLSLKINKDILR